MKAATIRVVFMTIASTSAVSMPGYRETYYAGRLVRGGIIGRNGGAGQSK
jgi:hypothetical protein